MHAAYLRPVSILMSGASVNYVTVECVTIHFSLKAIVSLSKMYKNLKCQIQRVIQYLFIQIFQNKYVLLKNKKKMLVHRFTFEV